MISEISYKDIDEVAGGWICADQPCGSWSSEPGKSFRLPGGRHSECYYTAVIWKYCGFEDSQTSLLCATTNLGGILRENTVEYCENPGAAIISTTKYAEGGYCYLVTSN